MIGPEVLTFSGNGSMVAEATLIETTMGDEIRPYSWGRWFGGGCLSFIGGLMLSIPAAMIATQTRNGFLGLLIGAAPGLLIAFFSRRVAQDDLRHGVFAGAIFILLLGGFCGGMAGFQS